MTEEVKDGGEVDAVASEENPEGSTVLTKDQDDTNSNSDKKADAEKTGEDKASDKADHKEGDTDDKSEDGDKKADKDKDGAPETYADFKLPEGVEVDEKLLPDFQSALKDLNATQEQAQSLVDMQVKQMQSMVEAQNQAWADTRKAWVEAGQTDAEFGKGKYDESADIARFAIREIGGLPLAKALEETGMGDHPELFRAFFRIGKLMKEDGITFGEAAKPAAKGIADRIYPNQGKKAS